MPLYYITGAAGSGKSTILSELKHRGYETHDIDSISNWFNEITGEFEPNLWPATAERLLDFYEKYTWKVPREKIENLAKSANNKIIFIGGSVANEKELIDLADKVFALVIDDKTLRHRLLTRTNNDYGKNPTELANELKWNKNTTDGYRDRGYFTIDATIPIEEIVEIIESEISQEPR